MTSNPSTESAPAAPLSNVFYLRNGNGIPVKPWTALFLAAHIGNVAAFIKTWGQDLAQDGIVQPDQLTLALPALEASCAVPADMEKLEGLGELMRFTKFVWDYNEIGVGLGEAIGLHIRIMNDLTGQTNSAVNPAE